MYKIPVADVESSGWNIPGSSADKGKFSEVNEGTDKDNMAKLQLDKLDKNYPFICV